MCFRRIATERYVKLKRNIFFFFIFIIKQNRNVSIYEKGRGGATDLNFSLGSRGLAGSGLNCIVF